MSRGPRSLPGRSRRRRLSVAALRRFWLRPHRLDRDLRLLAAIGLIAMGALAACLMTIREVEGHLLRTTATGAAVHWAEFLQSRLRGLDEILDAGLVTEEDQRIFEFAGAAGRVRDYQVFRPDGQVALSSWSGDFRLTLDPEILRSVIERDQTVANVVEDSLVGTRVVIGPAYVRSEAHTSELQSLMRISYAVFCLKKKTT